ncbi:MAG: hypothetical protein CBC42_07505 [Betaproteobacteria bacterium TMED82]|nr:MAG: hypothetical protein CBC42_07505 [Betaproteobacteria bacterium TMED82]|tara:strand:+ start:14437 stop:15216 length:780 start_codon:yes stop_codon:yes gene_type:complete
MNESELLLYGEPIKNIPEELYIPPKPLEVTLDSFQGPLDLLLYLIKKQNFNILDIPIATITSQYLTYVENVKRTDFESVAEYLLMAAVLIEIKSRMLLPKVVSEEEDIHDPRADLIKQLIEYEKFKIAAKKLDEMPRLGRDWLPVRIETRFEQKKILENLSVTQLKNAIVKILDQKLTYVAHRIKKEEWSTDTFMSNILNSILSNEQMEFSKLTTKTTSHRKLKIVMFFVALLELIKSGVVRIRQQSFNSSIWIERAKK